MGAARLPADIVARCLDFVDSTVDLRACALTCQDWRRTLPNCPAAAARAADSWRPLSELWLVQHPSVAVRGGDPFTFIALKLRLGDSRGLPDAAEAKIFDSAEQVLRLRCGIRRTDVAIEVQLEGPAFDFNEVLVLSFPSWAGHSANAQPGRPLCSHIAARWVDTTKEEYPVRLQRQPDHHSLESLVEWKRAEWASFAAPDDDDAVVEAALAAAEGAERRQREERRQRRAAAAAAAASAAAAVPFS
eukprot:TRINITY_DN60265_c0_g1_i1.p1 TRINITY_DN60265_c0_g1~~TRINITY_DN60265_c0_g1_i1.p1  ORF type:complete len:246 (+),score=74.87 TRINITY_DN60265_c0_g1_i1:83-820(+)